ncbi:hypothetical protein BH23BAC2_BH23BAC2_02930 [soil metagenome]
MVCVSCEAQVGNKKINGVSFVASRQEIKAVDLEPVINVNATAIAVMPFGFMESLESPHLRYNIERQWWGERLEGAGKTIQLAKEKGLLVLLKPQIWIWKGDFTGHIKLNGEEDWTIFENNYREFILLYAALAEKEKVEIFSLGTELNSFVRARPKFWQNLIAEVRQVYNGKLTYAENWDKIEEVPFWNELDYIGVDAYFPLSEERSPTLEDLKNSWKPLKNQLESLSKENKKPVLFTEYGYRNIDYAAKTPWESSRELKDLNNQNQELALQALYEEVWKEDWFAGGFLWKWFHNHEKAGGADDTQFTPQNKPAENVVRTYYNIYR